jgi:hypothetical protein
MNRSRSPVIATPYSLRRAVFEKSASRSIESVTDNWIARPMQMKILTSRKIFVQETSHDIDFSVSTMTGDV